MLKYEVFINGERACIIASSSRRDSLARIKASREQQTGAIWDRIKQFPPESPVKLIDLGRM